MSRNAWYFVKYCFTFTGKLGPPLRPLEGLKDGAYKNRTDPALQPVLEFLDQQENDGMSLKIFLARAGRRFCLDPNSRHYNPKDGQMFSRILNGEDVFLAPVLLPIDGVVLKTLLIIGQIFL